MKPTLLDLNPVFQARFHGLRRDLHDVHETVKKQRKRLRKERA